MKTKFTILIFLKAKSYKLKASSGFTIIETLVAVLLPAASAVLLGPPAALGVLAGAAGCRFVAYAAGAPPAGGPALILLMAASSAVLAKVAARFSGPIARFLGL